MRELHRGDTTLKHHVAGLYVLHLWKKIPIEGLDDAILESERDQSAPGPGIEPAPGVYLRVPIEILAGETTTVDVASHWR